MQTVASGAKAAIARRALGRAYASVHNATAKPPTAVIMLNMGGPSTLTDVQSFLTNLFSDADLIPLPFQSVLAPLIAKRRTPSIEAQYAAIGGGSPILKYTESQGAAMCALLDELRPQSAPHKHYTCFRYVDPLTPEVARRMKEDGVQRAVAFTQYPQYSCSTTGSSLNEIFRHARTGAFTSSVGDRNSSVEWSVIDRWPTHPGFIEAVAQRVEAALETFPPDRRADAVVLFSAHSLPMTVVNRGDPYVLEVSSSVAAVMERLRRGSTSVPGPVSGGKRRELAYRLVWQSQVGPRAWMGPQTSDALKGLARLGRKDVVLVPIAFTSDHIETLYELDHEYVKEAEELGMTVARAESLNDSPVFARALADIVSAHLDAYDTRKQAGEPRAAVSTQLMLRCPGCTNATCAQQKTFFARAGQ